MTDPSPWSAPTPAHTPPPRPPPWKAWKWLLVLGAIVAAGVAYLAVRFPEVLADGENQMRLTYSVLLLVFLCSSALLHRRFNLNQKLRHAGMWLALGAALFLGYAFRDDEVALWNRLAGELVPGRGTVADGVISFPATQGGHFVVEALVEGVPIRMMVDTGASTVVLSPADAKRLGIDLDALSFDTVFETANGIVRGAPVRLRRLVLGPIAMTDVRASVNGTPMRESLLGMSFLNRLSGYEVKGDRLTLRP